MKSAVYCYEKLITDFNYNFFIQLIQLMYIYFSVKSEYFPFVFTSSCLKYNIKVIAYEIIYELAVTYVLFIINCILNIVYVLFLIYYVFRKIQIINHLKNNFYRGGII